MKRIIAYLALLWLPMQAWAGGFIIVEPQGQPRQNSLPQGSRQFYTLECRSLSVNTVIQDQGAVTTIEQVFYNTTDQRLEGYFMFPVPKGCVISDFRMEINGTMMQAEMLDAPTARGIYEDIVRRMKDPALLEYAEQDLFRLRIFPIEPKSEKKIRITYTELLEKDNGTYAYVFPLNTKKYSAAPLQNVSIKVDVEASADIKTTYSPSHEIEVIRKDARHTVIGYESKQISPDMDFQLYYNTASSELGASFLSYRETGEDGFFFADISPGFVSDQEVMPKDVTLILDVSGSMVGDKLTQAKNALVFCVENLNPGDKFEIIRFSTEAQALFGKRVPYTEDAKKQALDFIKNLKAIGGTNMDQAFDLALQEKPSGDRPGMIIFITDGRPTIGETDEAKLLQKVNDRNTATQRIFTFGVGYDLNSLLLDKLTDQGHGYRTYVTPNEDIEVKVSDFFTKVSSPVLSDITVRFADAPNEYSVFPKKLPDLFKGSSLTIFGRYGKSGNTRLIVEGKVNGKPQTFTYDVKLEDHLTRHDFIAPLWATRNVGYLLDQIRLHGETKELKDEVVALAKEYGIITPYTSYLILEDEQLQTRNNTITTEQQLFAPRFNDQNRDMFFNSQRSQFDGLKSGEGEHGVNSSMGVQTLGNTSNTQTGWKEDKTLAYKDADGEERNLGQEKKNINGRAMYLVGNEWVDVEVQKNASMKTRRLQFASKEYFDLLNKEPNLAQYMSLGTNVRFVNNNELIEIFE